MFKKLLCAAALASAAFAQTIQITQPAAGTQISAGSTFSIRVEELSTSNINEEVALAIGVVGCMGTICFDVNTGLGNILYAGSFSPTSRDSAGNLYQDFSVAAPDYFNGIMQLNVAHFYTKGIHNVAELDFATTNITVTGSSG